MTELTAHLSISTEMADKTGNYQLIRFQGDLDKAGLASVKDQLESCTEKLAEAYLVFDFAKLNFINSESIGFLMTIHARLAKSGKALVLLEMQKNVKDVLAVIGLLPVLVNYDSLASFLEKITSQP